MINKSYKILDTIFRYIKKKSGTVLLKISSLIYHEKILIGLQFCFVDPFSEIIHTLYIDHSIHFSILKIKHNTIKKCLILANMAD